MIKALKKLSKVPDVVLVDGHGLSHPYRLGIASHLGVVLDIPSIGVAKSLLWGIVTEFKGDIAYVLDPDTREIIGAALKTHPQYKPIYVSVGHRIRLETAIEIVRYLVKASRGRLPLPLKLAHDLATKAKRRAR